MADLRIPTAPGVPNTRQRVVLDGVEYVLDIRWSQREERWYLDVRDTGGAMVLGSAKLVVNFPLLWRFRSTSGLPRGELFVVDGRSAPADPGLDDLGDVVHLVYQEAA